VAKRIDTLRAIVFDFDGVILESLDIKTEAFVALFADYPGRQKEIRAYHLDNIGVSRYVKFEHITRDILGLAYSEADRERLGAEFVRLTHERILVCPAVPGAKELLAWLRGRSLRIVASGTPEEELLQIVRERELTEWFDEVWGTPRTKPEILRDVLTSHALAAPDAIMVGDGMSDYEAARQAGIRFLARETGSVFAGMAVEKVRDLAEMREWLEGEDRP
jgi:phosphoglycolate phosphatase-like HAD superfamily hydrolase